MDKLGARLALIAAQVPGGSSVADIGTDHAFIPIFLVRRGSYQKIIAVENKSDPYKRAQENLIKYRVEEAVSLRFGNSLDVIEPGEVDTLIIAGLGKVTITDILEDYPEVVRKVSRLILQPMDGCELVRRWLHDNGWYLETEEVVYEGGHWYVVLVAVPGEASSRDRLLEKIGPRLAEKTDFLVLKYFKHFLHKLETAVAQMRKSTNPATMRKINDYTVQIDLIRGIIKCQFPVEK